MTTAPITFSGLSSGLDTSSLISSLVAAQKASEQPLQSQQSDLASQKSITDNITSIVSAFGDFADSVSLISDTQFRTATSSDTHVTVAVSGSAAATNHDIRVLATAAAQTTSSKTFATQAAGVLGAGTLTMQPGTGTPTTVSWDATDSLSDIATKINNANAGASASVLYDGTSYRLMVTSTKTGIANATTFTDSGDGLGLSDPANIKIPAADAKVSIDGVQVTRPTNIIDDALTGVTITANSAQASTDPDTNVAVTLDTTSAAAKLNDLVSKYNDANSALNDQLAYKGTTAASSTLFGDSTLELLQGDMSSIATGTFGSSSLDALGVSIDENGTMSLDTDKLNTALAANPNALSDLFVTGGLASALQGLSNTYTDPTNGVLVLKSQAMTTQTADLQTEIDQIDTNGAALQTRLEAQFNALEATMSTLQSQSATVTKMFATTTT